MPHKPNNPQKGHGPPPPKNPPPPGPGDTGGTVDPYLLVGSLMPWLPSNLVDLIVGFWSGLEADGDWDIALAQLRQTPEYDQAFPGIKRPDKTLIMSEMEYLSQMDGYRTLLLDFNINPDFFEDQFVGLLQGDVSVTELGQRLTSVYDRLVTNIGAVQEYYANTYGLEMTPSALLAAAIDPSVGDAILNQQISIAQIGGEAASAGFSIGADYATFLANAGLTQTEARGAFGIAANAVPTLDTLARRFNDPDNDVDLEEFIASQQFSDPAQARRFRRLIAQESSSFSGSGSVSRQGAALSGLVDN